MKFADYKAFEMTADAVEKDMENFDRIAKTADAMRLDHAQFEAWAKRHHYDLTRCSHEPYSAYRSDLTNAALAGWRGANGEAVPQADERAAFEWPLLPAFPPAMWTVGKTGFFTEHQMQGYANAYGELVRAAAVQPDHYQQLLGVAYVVMGCLAANGVDIPERFLGAFSDPDSVENPLELLPCDFSPARVVRAAVEGAALTDERAAIEELRNIANAKRFDHEMFADDTEFADWAQSRARHTLVHVTAPESSVPMELNCPSCAEPHVDIGEWATRPHKTHQCQKCGREWRPFAYTTVGIAPQATFECAARKNKVDALHIWEASRATAMEEAAQTALSKLKDLTTEMEGYSYFGSNPGVKEDDYDDVADAIRALAKGESE